MTDSDSDPTTINFGTLDQLSGYWLRQAQLTTFRHINDCFAEFDLTPGLFGVLEVVSRNPGLTQTAVANAIGNDRSVMVAIVDKLEKRGLVERRPSPSDRRSNALFLTQEGEALQEKVRERALQHNQEFFSFLNPEEHKFLFDILKRLALVDHRKASLL